MDELDRKVLEYIKKGSESEGSVDSNSISKNLGSKARQRAFNLAGRGLLHKEGTPQLAFFSFLERGERSLWPRWKRLMFDFIDAHGWELFKWMVSFATGGGALALTKWFLDKF